MRIENFSEQQLRVMSWWCEDSKYKGRDAVICDGAVRSGKTFVMGISFIAWAFYRFSDASFANGIFCRLPTAMKSIMMPKEDF